MDTKLKNKILYALCIIISMYLISFSILNALDFSKRSDYAVIGGYFKSNEFHNMLGNYIYDLIPYLRDYKNYEQKSDDEKVTADAFNTRKAQYDNNLNSQINNVLNRFNYILKNTEINKNPDEFKILKDEIGNEIDSIKTTDDIKKDLVLEQDKKYTDLKNKIQSQNFIQYYLKENSSDTTLTNIVNVDNIDNYIKANAFYSVKLPNKAVSDNFTRSMNVFLTYQGFDGYFIILKQSNSYNTFYQNYNNYNFMRKQTINEGIVCLVSFIISICILIISIKKFDSDLTFKNKLVLIYKKFPLEIKIVLMILYSMIIYKLIIQVKLLNNFSFMYYALDTTILVFYLWFWALNFLWIANIYIYKEPFKQQLKESITGRFISLNDIIFVNKGLMFKLTVVGIFTAIWGACFPLFIIYIGNFNHFIMYLNGIFHFEYSFIIALFFTFIPLYMILYVIFISKYAVKKIKLLTSIIIDTDKIAAGNFSGMLNEAGKGNLPRLAHNINSMQEGIKKSLEKQMKSERLKSELITNVSHDLKTPLTTIINYVDILKRDGLSREEIHDYITILDRKAQRLKLLIEDLFEASKVTSGAVELNIEKIEVVALLNQALAEFEEKIKASSIIFKINIPSKKVYTNLDGKRTWRVFENLISNILKYSQPSTRAYIDLSEQGSKIIITMKNISAYELDFNADEIFERFKRGDKSRNTEGSGLGLAISKSIVELEHGKLDIKIDGDFFKATIIFDIS